MLKQFVLISSMLLLGSFLRAQVQFFEGTFEEAKMQASKEGKGLFLDFYADWCVPCKQMEKYGFKDENFSSKIEAHFIAVKVDVDMFVGMDVAEAYRVNKYPTLILTDERAKELQRREGYQSIEQLNDFVKAYR